MTIEVEYTGTPVFARVKAEASVLIGILDVHGFGETHEDARKDLLHRVRLHQAEVARAVEAIEASEAPKVEPAR